MPAFRPQKTPTARCEVRARKAARRPRAGKRMLARLHAVGINARNVTQSRHTGLYIVDFGDSDIDNFESAGTEPARVWARRIRDALPGVEVVDTHDAVADWRPNRPVLTATVFLRDAS